VLNVVMLNVANNPFVQSVVMLSVVASSRASFAIVISSFVNTNPDNPNCDFNRKIILNSFVKTISEHRSLFILCLCKHILSKI
jgi:hypothetical protein